MTDLSFQDLTRRYQARTATDALGGENVRKELPATGYWLLVGTSDVRRNTQHVRTRRTGSWQLERATSDERRATSDERRATSDERRATIHLLHIVQKVGETRAFCTLCKRWAK
ncbi:MAG: hypothetical protein ACFCVC_15505, partial [Acidimicrobiia bacterium]